MELRHLRYFVAAAEEENISRAALRLHISQPAISRQIRDLEDEISIRLFERRARALSLTVAGSKFLEEARSVLRHAEEAVARTKSWIETGIGELHVGYAPFRLPRYFQERSKRSARRITRSSCIFTIYPLRRCSCF